MADGVFADDLALYCHFDLAPVGSSREACALCGSRLTVTLTADEVAARRRHPAYRGRVPTER